MGSDYGDFCRATRELRRERRAKLGVTCPKCPTVRPKAHPSILLPRQKCRVCGYRDPRPHEYHKEATTHSNED